MKGSTREHLTRDGADGADVLCCAPRLIANRYTNREKESREVIREMSMTASRTLRPMRVLMVFIESLVLAWAIMTLGNYFGWHVGPRSLY